MKYLVLAVLLVASPAAAQTTEQRLWRLQGGVASGRGDELLAAAYEPGPQFYAAVDFVTRTPSSMRSLGYFFEYSLFPYENGAFWNTIRNSSGSTGSTILEGAPAYLAALGAVGKFGPIFGKARPYGSLSFALFRNKRRPYTVPGLNQGETDSFELGSKSGLQTGIGVGADIMGRRLGATIDAGYQINWTTSRLDKRFEVCQGSSCHPTMASPHTLYVRAGVALVRGTF